MLVLLYAILLAAYLYRVFHKPYLRLFYPNGQNYLTRWKFFNNRWFRVYLHRLDGPDPDRHLHNHPWNGLVLVLRKPGSYVQLTCPTLSGSLMTENVGRINRLNGTFHKIVIIQPGTWTLTIAGPVRRPWGFRANGRFVPWLEYIERYQKGVMNATGTVSGSKIR